MPANWQHNAVSVAVGSGAGGEPGALAWLDRHAAGLVAGRGLAVAVSLFLIQLIIAAAVLGRWHRNTWLVAGVVVAVCFWVFGQNLGEIFTGQATDPNTGPLLMLLAVGLIDRTGTANRAAASPAAPLTRIGSRRQAGSGPGRGAGNSSVAGLVLAAGGRAARSGLEGRCRSSVL